MAEGLITSFITTPPPFFFKFYFRFVVFAKRTDTNEARIRLFCMTDDREDKTLEHKEHFTEVSNSRDVEVCCVYNTIINRYIILYRQVLPIEKIT